MSIYTLSAPGVTFAQNKALLGIFNGSGSGQIVKILKIVTLNNQTVAVTGTNLILELRRITTGSGGFAIAPIKHDTDNPNLPSQIICATNLTYTEDVTSSLFRRLYWSNDEPLAAGINTIDEIQTVPFMNIRMDSPWSTYDTTVEPITLREGYGIIIKNTTNSIVGVADFFIEFSMEETP